MTNFVVVAITKGHAMMTSGSFDELMKVTRHLSALRCEGVAWNGFVVVGSDGRVANLDGTGAPVSMADANQTLRWMREEGR